MREEHIREIVKLMLKIVSNRVEDQGIKLEFTEEAEKILAKEGYDTNYGARPLRRAITKIVEDKLSEEILKGNIKKGDSVKVNTIEDKLNFSKI